jgi:hypothetical protein
MFTRDKDIKMKHFIFIMYKFIAINYHVKEMIMLKKLCFNLSNLNKSCSNLNKLYLNLSQKIITLTR